MEVLFRTFSPAAVCLQETFQHDNNIINFRHYTQYYKNSVKQDGSPGGGVAIFVLNNIPHSSIELTTGLQATAVRISLHKAVTLCSLYLPPNMHIPLHDLNDLIDQLPPPALIMGDFNAHSPFWGNASLDNRGKIVEDFVASKNLCILNSKMPTYLHPATGSKTSIDLTITHPSLVMDFTWCVHDDLSGSDHFPVLLRTTKPLPQQTLVRWKVHKGDWCAFQELCKEELAVGCIPPSQNDIAGFTDQLISIAERTVPKTNPNPARVRKPWFNDVCREAVTSRKRALRVFSQNATAQT